ncbi:VTT domain-containing protein [Roseomonas sp. E05]|uniref:YqaA family protein n=1 Tax=Roseomonas sp. E05 TaxID=3046310 RepID=UPI0024BAB1FF|nr:VTT domain-containing protein [Roseomonas sp. E05]MDJ0389642.1 VTT domain-containing protein [Roseomonas sp. E05]
MLRALYERILYLAGHRRAGTWLALVSFAESSFFPIPPDAMLVPMCLARPERAWRYAATCTMASVLGGLLGYALGFFLFEAVAQPVLAAYGHAQALETFRAWFDRWGAAVILIKGLTPIPFKIVTIAAGAAAFNPWIFLITSALTRGARFFLLALLLRRYGTPMRSFIERRLTLLTSVVAVAILCGFAALRLI